MHPPEKLKRNWLTPSQTRTEADGRTDGRTDEQMGTYVIIQSNFDTYVAI